MTGADLPKAAIRQALPPHDYDTWIAPVEGAAEGDVAVLRVPNATFGTHLEAEFRDVILRAFAEAGSPVTSVRCEVTAATAAPAAAPAPETPSSGDELSSVRSFDSFIVAASNRTAHDAALAVSEPGLRDSPFNPLLIWGGPGRGKTHLLHAIGRRFLKHNPGRRLFHARGDTFTTRLVNAIRARKLFAFREECGGADMLLVDSFQFIAGLDRFGRSAEEFFHALTALSERGRPAVLTADRRPADFRMLDDRIRRRLEAGLATEIGRPERALRAAIASRHAEALGVELADGIADAIAERTASAPQTLGLVNLASLRAAGDAITGTVLGSIKIRRPSVQDVQVAVAREFGVPPLLLVGRELSAEPVLARQVAMYLCRETTGLGAREIGSGFRRSHAAVLRGARRIAAARERDLGLDRVVERLLEQLS